MTKNIALVLTFLAGLPLAVAAQVSKEDLKKLGSAGISDDVILSYVKANGPVAKLSAEDVIELKQAGVSEKVLTVVLAGPTAAPQVTERIIEKQAPATTYVYDSTPYYYTPSVTYSDYYYSPYPRYYSSYSYPHSYYYSSYSYPRYYSSSYCYPRYSYGVSISSGRTSRGSLGVSGYRR